MTKKQMIDYWKRTASEDVITAESLFQSSRFLPCLFYCHSFVEKLLKGLIVKKSGEPAPIGHKLVRLANLTGLNFTLE